MSSTPAGPPGIETRHDEWMNGGWMSDMTCNYTFCFIALLPMWPIIPFDNIVIDDSIDWPPFVKSMNPILRVNNRRHCYRKWSDNTRNDETGLKDSTVELNQDNKCSSSSLVLVRVTVKIFNSPHWALTMSLRNRHPPPPSPNDAIDLLHHPNE